jgi:hypothetical protein
MQLNLNQIASTEPGAIHTPGHMNINLDVQRYYSPYFNGHVFDEVLVLNKTFQEEKERLESDLKKRGLI